MILAYAQENYRDERLGLTRAFDIAIQEVVADLGEHNADIDLPRAAGYAASFFASVMNTVPGKKKVLTAFAVAVSALIAALDPHDDVPAITEICE